jgi:hypothetical protein
MKWSVTPVILQQAWSCLLLLFTLAVKAPLCLSWIVYIPLCFSERVEAG